jgi:hypothetical protein
MNALYPDKMTAAARLDELGKLLAPGLTRLHGRKSSQICADRLENSLVLPSHQSNPEKAVICEGAAV